MKVPGRYYDEVFEFEGQWGQPSRCGLKISSARDGRTVVVVTELYQDNTGTSVTSAGASLARQICQARNIRPEEVVYLECNPGTESKLSFYDEQYFEVIFPAGAAASGGAVYRSLSAGEVKELLD